MHHNVWSLLTTYWIDKREQNLAVFQARFLSVYFILPIICRSVDRFSSYLSVSRVERSSRSILYICTGFLTHKFGVFHFHRDLSSLLRSHSLSPTL